MPYAVRAELLFGTVLVGELPLALAVLRKAAVLEQPVHRRMDDKFVLLLPPVNVLPKKSAKLAVEDGLVSPGRRRSCRLGQQKPRGNTEEK